MDFAAFFSLSVQYETKLEQERMKVSEYKDKLVKNLSEMRKAEAITVKATQDVESRDRKIEALNHKVNDSVKVIVEISSFLFAVGQVPVNLTDCLFALCALANSAT